MPDEFDPYHRWLGIGPNEQPPHHYRLLGINLWESDPEVIRDAAARQMAHVRTYQLGSSQALSQKILNELGVAKACLSDPQKKAAYDAQLRQKLAQSAQAPLPDVVKSLGDARLEQFVRHLQLSGLLSAAEISEFYAGLPAADRPRDAAALGRGLLKAGLLTKYQVQTVYQGKTKGLVFGEYRVLDKLGQGGMGVVLKAEHQRMKRIVAVKMIAGAALKSPDAVKRFYREVQAAAQLNHPNIVTAYDAGQQEGVHYLVMEYVEGKDLATIIKENGPLPVNQAVECVVQAARGLQYAHEVGIVHRDIKPGNLLVDKKGTVKILDMGLAKAAGPGAGGSGSGSGETEPLTISGQVMGTCDYMSPEQAVDTRSVDPRADIYSLGCTLYRLLRGEPLYTGETLVQVLMAHQQAAIPSLRAGRPDVPPELDAVYQKMVAKRPDDRQQSMAQVIAELEACFDQRSGAGRALADRAARRDELSLTGMTLLGEGGGALTALANRRPAESLTPPAAGPSAPGTARPSVTRRLLATARQKPVLTSVLAVVLVGTAVVLATRGWGSRDEEVLGPSSIAQSGPSEPGRVGPLDRGDTPRLGVAASNGGSTAKNTETQPPVSNPQPPIPNPRSLIPAPAVAPFDAGQARQHQEAWAKHLGIPREQSNSIGMPMALIPPGEFPMGSTAAEVAAALEDGQKRYHADKGYFARVPTEAPRHRVAITRPFYLGLFPVTQAEYLAVMGVNPSSFTEKQRKISSFQPPLTEAEAGYRTEDRTKVAGQDTRRHPVEGVAWEEAVEFCRRLSALPAEQAAGRVYRLPTEAEWEYACRAGTTTAWYFGNEEAELNSVAWFNKNGANMSHPVGQKKPNPWGLFDMSGNIEQWCADWYGGDYYQQSPSADPPGPRTGTTRVLRGGSWFQNAAHCRSAFRLSSLPPSRLHDIGFRAVCELAPPAGAPRAAPAAPPPTADAPFDAATARQRQEAWAKHLGLPVQQSNAVGIKLTFIPPGQFDMGSTAKEIKAALEDNSAQNQQHWYADAVPAEGPRHRVEISRPFYLGACPVTQAQYQQVMGVNPSGLCAKQVDLSTFKPPLTEDETRYRLHDVDRMTGQDTSDCPVETVSWDEAVEFCRRLSAMPAERAAHHVYRLPSEAQWEYACRAGTTTRWYSGDDEASLDAAAWYRGNSGSRSHPVGQKRPNAWGLYDMHGNVWQWCADWSGSDYYKRSPASDPPGPATGAIRISRGGDWSHEACHCRAAFRCRNVPDFRSHNRGFRVALDIELVSSAPPAADAAAAPAAAPSPPPSPAASSASPVPAPRSRLPAPYSVVPSASPAAPARQPLPTGTVLEAADARVADAYKSGYQEATTATARLALVRRMLKQVADGYEDPAGRYALLHTAQGIAVAAGELNTALEIVDRIALDFAVDASALKADLLTAQFNAAKTTAQRKPLLDLSLKLAGEALDQGSRDAAQRLLKLASSELIRFRSKELVQQIKSLRARLDAPASLTAKAAPPPARAPFDAAAARRYQRLWADYLGRPVVETNSLGMPLTLIPPGEFDMGSSTADIAAEIEHFRKSGKSERYTERVRSEGPSHRVTITRPFYLGVYHVTQAEYQQVMGVNPSAFCAKPVPAAAFDPPLTESDIKSRQDDLRRVRGDDTRRYPVDTVSCDDALEFCRRLSALPAERAAKRVYRLPSEAQWEYACRAGTASRGFYGDDHTALAGVAWFHENADATTHPVGQKLPNPWGLYDICGNATQWCADWYNPRYYQQSPASDPTGPASPDAGSLRVIRGGSFRSTPPYCRSAFRGSNGSNQRAHDYGFRVVMER